MKVVMVSNFGIDNIEERIAMLDDKQLINLVHSEAHASCEAWNKLNASDISTYYAVVKPDDYVLWRGMADLVGD